MIDEPWDKLFSQQRRDGRTFYLHLATAHAPSRSNSLPLSCMAQGTVGTRRDRSLFAIKPERPLDSLFLSSHFRGWLAWGVLDYAVHTFAL